METQMEKFDPSKLMDGVRDRIKSTFISLIPDDQWDKLVQAEIHRFFNAPSEERRNYNGRSTLTHFQEICDAELEKFAREKIAKFFTQYANHDSTYFGEVYIPNINEHLKKLLEEAAPKLFVSAMGSMFQNVVNSMASNRY